jgi:hypothetical protein
MRLHDSLLGRLDIVPAKTPDWLLFQHLVGRKKVLNFWLFSDSS